MFSLFQSLDNCNSVHNDHDYIRATTLSEDLYFTREKLF